MPRLPDFQRAFAAAVVGAPTVDPAPDPSSTLADALAGDGVPVARRLDVYRNNVFHSLTEAMGQAFPVVHRLVGDAFFKATAREFVLQSMPQSGTLIGFGDGFAEFLERFEPAQSLPYLPDVARLELAWLAAYHAADAEPLSPADLAQVAPERMAGLRLALHPSARFVSSPYPILDIWRANREDNAVGPVDLTQGGGSLMAIRPRLEVEVRRLTPGLAAFLSVCAKGGTLTDAADAALAAEEEFDLTRALHGLIRGETFAAFQV